MHCATALPQLLQERNKLEVKGYLSCINCKTADMQLVRLVGDDDGRVLLKVSRAYAEQLESPADRGGAHLSSKRATLQKVRVSGAHTDPCITAVAQSVMQAKFAPVKAHVHLLAASVGSRAAWMRDGLPIGTPGSGS